MLGEEFDEILQMFQPEPLVPVFENKDEPFEIPVVEEGIDLAKVNYLNFLNDDEIKKVAEETIRHYGVGTCGPRAFYGSTDLHVELEDRLTKFLRMKDTIVYAYGFSALSTSIASIFKRDDTIFVDEEVNFPIQQGIQEGRSQSVTFAHNDAKDFRQKVVKAREQHGSSFGRFMLVLEAISWNTGRVCPLPDFLAVTEEFKMRVLLDESYSFGVLGATGRGLAEYYDIDPNRIDCVFGTLEGALGSSGGFCSSSDNEAVEIQRLRSTGYVYSNSTPTYLIKVVLKALELLGDKPTNFSRLTKMFHTFLKEECGFNVVSDPQSPFQVIKNNPHRNQKIHEHCKRKGVHFICSENSLIIHLNINLLEDKKMLEKVYGAFKQVSNLIG